MTELWLVQSLDLKSDRRVVTNTASELARSYSQQVVTDLWLDLRPVIENINHGLTALSSHG